jgi:diguanylate cyclase (GGDEF)-like protein
VTPFDLQLPSTLSPGQWTDTLVVLALATAAAWVALRAGQSPPRDGPRIAKALLVSAALGAARAVAMLAALNIAGKAVGAPAVLGMLCLAAVAASLGILVSHRPSRAVATVAAGVAGAMLAVAWGLGRGQFNASPLGLIPLAGFLIAEGLIVHGQRALTRSAGRATLAWLGLRSAAAGLSSALPLLGVALLPHGAAEPSNPFDATLPAVLVAIALALAALSQSIERRYGGIQHRLQLKLREAKAQGGSVPLVDMLSGLPNAAGFEAWLGPAVADARRRGGAVAVLVIGLDGFKRVNDAFGRRGGDSALIELARRLGAACDGLAAPPAIVPGPIARIGGDEFAIALQGRPQSAELARVAAVLLEMVARRMTLDGGETNLGASIGMAIAPQDGNEATLLPHAQAALRAAKEAGGATYVFFETRLVDEARDRLELLRDLRRAVEAKQFELYYQPKIDARSGQVTAAEALLRWHHPSRGLVSPMVFVPLAERFGLIESIGRWVIDDACRQAAVWRKAGLKMRVAINLSAQQMRGDDLVEQILGALKRYGIDPSRLTCEITETVAMEDTQVTHRTFDLLGNAGIHVSIDDFGTGYSSLAYLRKLPAQELKIDRAFVKDLATSADARAIVDAIVKLAHAIGLKVVAEGVETEMQRDALLQLGCDELQGYMFAKPMTARALLIWAMDDRPAQHAFRSSLFASTSTPTMPMTPS